MPSGRFCLHCSIYLSQAASTRFKALSFDFWTLLLGGTSNLELVVCESLHALKHFVLVYIGRLAVIGDNLLLAVGCGSR